MRQRLGIAQAIAGNPRLIIVDEPTAGLDPEERLRFYRLLAELAEDRIVLLSTHIVEDVAVLCPKFAVIRGGKPWRLPAPPARAHLAPCTSATGSGGLLRAPYSARNTGGRSGAHASRRMLCRPASPAVPVWKITCC